MLEIIRREWVYFWYYFSLQIELIAPYWILGMILGSAVSVFFKDRIHMLFVKLVRGGDDEKSSLTAIIPASLLGIASPLCMYGTIPIAASFSAAGIGDAVLASFMTASVLLNPQLLIYTAALGKTAIIVRFVSCFICGIAAGFAVSLYCRVSGKSFFNFAGFSEKGSRDTDPNILLRYLKNLRRNVKATAPWFLAGIAAAALYQRYVPAEAIGRLFGKHEAFGLLTAAALGIPLYMCGGGTIALIAGWLADGMSMGGAAAFMISGPATKITNLGALKIVLGAGRFAAYIAFIVVFAAVTGLITDMLI